MNKKHFFQLQSVSCLCFVCYLCKQHISINVVTQKKKKNQIAVDRTAFRCESIQLKAPVMHFWR